MKRNYQRQMQYAFSQSSNLPFFQTASSDFPSCSLRLCGEFPLRDLWPQLRALANRNSQDRSRERSMIDGLLTSKLLYSTKNARTSLLGCRCVDREHRARYTQLHRLRASAPHPLRPEADDLLFVRCSVPGGSNPIQSRRTLRCGFIELPYALVFALVRRVRHRGDLLRG